MSRLTRDGTVEPVSRDQVLRHEQRGQGNIHFTCSADHEQDWQPYLVDSHPWLYVWPYMHNNSVLSLHYKYKNASRARGHKEGQRLTLATSWGQPATQTNRDPNRDKVLARSSHSRTSETYRRQDDVFGYELQFS